MDIVNQIIQSLSSYCWPIIALIALFIFNKPIIGLIESARDRKFTLKVAGNEITMEELTEQQAKIISDLQNKVVIFQKELDSKQTTLTSELRNKIKGELWKTRNILWVDDKPSNNSVLIEYFENQGLHILTALSTKEALSIIRNKEIDNLITNMGRRESGYLNRTAGIELIKNVREINKDIKIPEFKLIFP